MAIDGVKVPQNNPEKPRQSPKMEHVPTPSSEVRSSRKTLRTIVAISTLIILVFWAFNTKQQIERTTSVSTEAPDRASFTTQLQELRERTRQLRDDFRAFSIPPVSTSTSDEVEEARSTSTPQALPAPLEPTPTTTEEQIKSIIQEQLQADTSNE